MKHKVQMIKNDENSCGQIHTRTFFRKEEQEI